MPDIEYYLRDYEGASEAPLRTPYEPPRDMAEAEHQLYRCAAAQRAAASAVEEAHISNETANDVPVEQSDKQSRPMISKPQVTQNASKNVDSDSNLDASFCKELGRWLPNLLEEFMEDEETLLDEIQRRRVRCIERLIDATTSGSLHERRDQEELIVQLIAEEFLPEAYERREVVAELALTAAHPDILWEEYEKVEEEDLEEFIDTIYKDIFDYLAHNNLVETIPEQQGESLEFLLHKLQQSLGRVYNAIKARLLTLGRGPSGSTQNVR